MKRNRASLLAITFLSAILCWIYLALMPQSVSDDEGLLSEFSTTRALREIKAIAAFPHYAGSENHKKITFYLIRELAKLGLQPEIQQGYTLSQGVLVKSQNIVAKINGSDSKKALLLLSHYDSAPHSYSYGASDDGAGIAVILESVRAFLHNKTHHKNDIIILFSDAEELGLNGAALFVTQHRYAKKVGLALNFEARGTSGPSYMLMEVNHGNAAMVDAFSAASPQYPVSNSLMYSIYKMMPNDTDLTVFREQGNVQGFNFAFIDDHYNYHTVQDNYAHVSPKTIAHQASYLMPLLQYCANADLTNLNSTEDSVYFNTPVFFAHYPFSWIFPMLAAALLLFLFLVFIGIGKRILFISEMAKGFVPLFGAIVTVSAVTFFGWRTLLAVYPQYNDILQGFPYNGHSYIAAFLFLALAACFLFYIRTNTETLAANHAIAPLVVWIAANFTIAFLIPGAAFFIIPVFCGLMMLGYFVLTQRTNLFFNLIFSIPVLVIFAPYLVMFPVGLGLKILAGSTLLAVLVFGMLLPVFASFPKKGLWSILFFLISIGFFINAHVNSGYEYGKAKPNSLLYIYDSDNDKAVWATYDKRLDDWTKVYFENPQNAGKWNKNLFYSKYNSALTYTDDALVRDIPEPEIDFITDSVYGKNRYLKIRITPKRKVNRYDIFANENIIFRDLTANGASESRRHGRQYLRNGRQVLRYYVTDNEPLVLAFSISATTPLDMELMESSFDLIHNSAFRMERRKSWMMPMPFVLNDAVVISKKIRPVPKVIIPIQARKNFSFPEAAISDTIPDPDAEN